MTQMIARALKIGAALTAIVAVQQASAATTPFKFTTTGGNNSLVASKTISSNTVDGKKINATVTAWHGVDNAKTGVSTITAGKVGLYSPGLGDWVGDGKITNDHQLDDYNGFDFLAIQFDQNVTLSSISRVTFQLGGFKTGNDALWFADTAGTYGTAASWTKAPTFTTLKDSLWADVSAKGTLDTTKSASLWLIGVNFKDCDYDAFKLAGLSVTVPTRPSSPPTSPVPEPASWAMMIGGFGLIGGALRRRPRTNVAFG